MSPVYSREHTPAPWRLRKTATHVAIDSIADKADPYTVLIDSVTGDKEMEAQFKADARRIVACVNFLDDTSTMALENGAMKYGKMTRYYQEAIAERDILREEVRKLRAALVSA